MTNPMNVQQSRRSVPDIWTEHATASTWSDTLSRLNDAKEALQRQKQLSVDQLHGELPSKAAMKDQMRATGSAIRTLSDAASVLTIEFITAAVERGDSYNQIGQWLEIDPGTVRRWYLEVSEENSPTQDDEEG